MRSEREAVIKSPQSREIVVSANLRPVTMGFRLRSRHFSGLSSVVTGKKPHFWRFAGVNVPILFDSGPRLRR